MFDGDGGADYEAWLRGEDLRAKTKNVSAVGKPLTALGGAGVAPADDDADDENNHVASVGKKPVTSAVKEKPIPQHKPVAPIAKSKPVAQPASGLMAGSRMYDDGDDGDGYDSDGSDDDGSDNNGSDDDDSDDDDYDYDNNRSSGDKRKRSKTSGSARRAPSSKKARKVISEMDNKAKELKKTKQQIAYNNKRVASLEDSIHELKDERKATTKAFKKLAIGYGFSDANLDKASLDQIRGVCNDGMTEKDAETCIDHLIDYLGASKQILRANRNRQEAIKHGEELERKREELETKPKADPRGYSF